MVCIRYIFERLALCLWLPTPPRFLWTWVQGGGAHFSLPSQVRCSDMEGGCRKNPFLPLRSAAPVSGALPLPPPAQTRPSLPQEVQRHLHMNRRPNFFQRPPPAIWRRKDSPGAVPPPPSSLPLPFPPPPLPLRRRRRSFSPKRKRRPPHDEKVRAPPEKRPLSGWRRRSRTRDGD